MIVSAEYAKTAIIAHLYFYNFNYFMRGHNAIMDSISESDRIINSELLPLCIHTCRGRLLFAGPCSAESAEQVSDTAHQLAAVDPNIIFRAGAWKPRTTPGTFAGKGVEALNWLSEVKRNTGLLTATEVATPQHVQEAERAGIDIFWIGARTVAGPFAVQALADAISKVCPQKPVFIKNPVSPDIELWIGAIARFINAGVRRLGAIHRGFSVYKSAPYRNSPIWQIPMELHRRLPALPIIHDPSHTGGKRDHIRPLSQKALDMGFAGLMIETHPMPEVALSDGGQQLTPHDFERLFNELKIRDTEGVSHRLEQLRSQIDEIDNELLSVLARRMEISHKIGEYKLEADMPVMQPGRYARLLTSLLDQGTRLGLDSSFLTDLLERIHAESVRTQLAVLNPPTKL